VSRSRSSRFSISPVASVWPRAGGATTGRLQGHPPQKNPAAEHFPIFSEGTFRGRNAPRFASRRRGRGHALCRGVSGRAQWLEAMRGTLRPRERPSFDGNLGRLGRRKFAFVGSCLVDSAHGGGAPSSGGYWRDGRTVMCNFKTRAFGILRNELPSKAMHDNGWPLERGLVAWRTGASGLFALLRVPQPPATLRLLMENGYPGRSPRLAPRANVRWNG
jgi:hypothetical protein